MHAVISAIVLKKYTSHRSGRNRRCQTLRIHSPGGSSFLREMTSWPPSWNYDVVSEIRLSQLCGFARGAFLPNFIPIRFETTEPLAFLKRSPKQEQQQEDDEYSDMRSVHDRTRNTLDCGQSNVYSSHVVSSAISQDLLFRSFSLYRGSATDPPLWNKFRICIIID